MQSSEKIYRQFAEALTALFSPLVEVSLFQGDKKLYTFNALTNQDIHYPRLEEIQTIVFNKNQQGKLVYLDLTDGYSLRIIVEVSLFLTFQSMLKQYLSTHDENKSINNWQTQVEHIIEDFLSSYHKKFSDLSNQDKRKLILRLYQEGLFRYQDATRLLAVRLNVSRATIYNYLKQASQLQLVEIHQVDAFTDKPFEGNPAGVVFEAEKLNDELMKKIAREVNLSETSFILPSQRADFKLRYFTPSGDEVKFCGHSTVGALYMLAHEKLFGINKPGRYQFTMETKVGSLPVAINYQKKPSISLEYQTPIVELTTTDISHRDLANALDIPLEAINTDIPVMFEHTNQDIFLTINSLKLLGELKINDKSAKQFAQSNLIVAFVLVSNQVVHKENDLHMRCFAPAVGISEDPFTGSVLGGLACYARRYGLVPRNRKNIFVEQGHFISRPGYVRLEVNLKNLSAPATVIANARHFSSSKINI